MRYSTEIGMIRPADPRPAQASTSSPTARGLAVRPPPPISAWPRCASFLLRPRSFKLTHFPPTLSRGQQLSTSASSTSSDETDSVKST